MQVDEERRGALADRDGRVVRRERHARDGRGGGCGSLVEQGYRAVPLAVLDALDDELGARVIGAALDERHKSAVAAPVGVR